MKFCLYGLDQDLILDIFSSLRKKSPSLIWKKNVFRFNWDQIIIIEFKILRELRSQRYNAVN